MHQLSALSSGGERSRAQSRERLNCTRTRGVTWSRHVLRAEEEGWAHRAGSQSPFLALPPAPSLTLDKLQRHQIFRQLLLLFGPRPTRAGSALAHRSQSPTVPCPSGRVSSRLLSCDPISSSFVRGTWVGRRCCFRSELGESPHAPKWLGGAQKKKQEKKNPPLKPNKSSGCLWIVRVDTGVSLYQRRSGTGKSF